MTSLRPWTIGLRRRWPYSFCGCPFAGSTLGYFLRLDLPDVQALEDYRPPEMSLVLAADGSTLGTFAEQRRILLRYDEIPDVFERALIATEDSNFYTHTGIDIRGILRAIWADVRTMSMAEGASTVTQQLARNLFLHPDKTIRRKFQEILLALEIERQYSKQEILRFYCNQIYTGHGRWGIEAASRYYFGKPALDMSLTEAATIAGLLQRPESLSPFKHPERSLNRRNHVLDRMVHEGLLEPEIAAEAKAQPVVVSESRTVEQQAPYFVEEVRRWIQDQFGSSSLYQDGLEVRTTLEPRLQQIAERAMDHGLRELDRRQGWRGVPARVPDGEDPEIWSPPGWDRGIEVGRVYDGVIVGVDETQATVRIGEGVGILGPDEYEWTRAKDVATLFRTGDMPRVRVTADDGNGGLTLTLEQEPLAEAALIAIEPQTGAIVALVGGFDFGRSEFDRAMQAKRQTGSAFKPLLFAAALDDGWTLADTLLDEPTVFLDRSNPDPYQPENYSNSYYETVTLRQALEKSANISSVKLLNEVGYEDVIATSRKLGIESPLHPFPSLALGAFGARLIELTSAYGAFANGGVRVEPHFVEEVLNADGGLVRSIEPSVQEAVGPEVAYLMNRVLRGVVTDGTGKLARSIPHPIAGKTGTTDDNTDAWFIGYSARLAVGVWVGFDEPRSLGTRETGALAALPIWRSFMEAALETEPVEEFATPPGVTVVSIDRDTGLKANLAAECGNVFSETFVRGTEPTRYCTKQHHRLLRLPYPFQRFPLDEAGRLVIGSAELRALLDEELDAYVIDGGSRLEVYTAEGTVTMPLQVIERETSDPIPAELRGDHDVAAWVGTDGRMARILWLK